MMDGFIEIKTDGVFYNPKTNRLVVLGSPSKNQEHNCDEMGCGSMDHVLIRAYLTTNSPINLGRGE